MWLRKQRTLNPRNLKLGVTSLSSPHIFAVVQGPMPSKARTTRQAIAIQILVPDMRSMRAAWPKVEEFHERKKSLIAHASSHPTQAEAVKFSDISLYTEPEALFC